APGRRGSATRERHNAGGPRPPPAAWAVAPSICPYTPRGRTLGDSLAQARGYVHCLDPEVRVAGRPDRKNFFHELVAQVHDSSEVEDHVVGFGVDLGEEQPRREPIERA